MSDKIGGNLPPTYQAAQLSVQQQAMMSQLQGVVGEERGPGTGAETETERLRSFLIFTLALDYHRNRNAFLSSEDREHFTALSNCLNDLETAHKNTHLKPAKREALAPYFWRYLHEPCHSLAVPVECAAQAILRFTKFQDHRGRYKGSVYGVLHTQGLEALARKINMDRSLLIPRLVADLAVRREMVSGVVAIGRMYFTDVHAIEGSTVASATLRDGWQDLQSMRFTLNERGEAYKASRNLAKTTSKQGASLSLAHWAGRIKTVTTELLKRREHYPEGKEKADANGSWKDANQPNGPGLSQYSENGWLSRRSTHLPEFFENRVARGCCDT